MESTKINISSYIHHKTDSVSSINLLSSASLQLASAGARIVKFMNLRVLIVLIMLSLCEMLLLAEASPTATTSHVGGTCINSDQHELD